MKDNIKIKLIIMNFLQFAVWGAYLTCMGNYLGNAGMGSYIAWFYAIQGIVSIFMPTIMGIVADKLIQPQRLLGLCHLIAGVTMIGCFYIGHLEAPLIQEQLSNNVATADLVNTRSSIFVIFYIISVAFYMPTIALANTVAFTSLKDRGFDTVKEFPPIRVLGTIGFIATMWFVNCATPDGFTLDKDDDKFQFTHLQFLVSGALSIVMFLYCFVLPKCRNAKAEDGEKPSLAKMLGADAFKLMKSKNMALFFLFSAGLGMALQVTNGFAGPFISSFQASEDVAIANSFAATNATLLTSLSQISEACCILLIPFFLKRFGIKIVMLMAMTAWVFRFGFFGLGDPTMPGVLLFILSCIVYGVAFDFFNVSGAMYVDQECEPSIKASAQGLFMMMTNGVGATIGTLVAGTIVNKYCNWISIPQPDGKSVSYLVGDWQACWFIFAGYALVVAILFAIFFKNPKKAKLNV